MLIYNVLPTHPKNNSTEEKHYYVFNTVLAIFENLLDIQRK